MKTERLQNFVRNKFSFLSFVIWSLIVIHAIAAFAATYIVFEDLTLVLEGQISDFGTTIVLLMSFAIFSIPLQFSIGLLFRKNWARIGILVVSALGMAGPLIEVVLFSVVGSPDQFTQSVSFMYWFWVNRVLPRIPIILVYFLVFRYFTRKDVRNEFGG